MSPGPPSRALERLAALYEPIARQILARRDAAAGPFVVGLCGPQGSGKSTGAAVLRGLIENEGLRAAVLSLDDLYLTRSARLSLAADVHPLLATRGPPGTHEVDLGLKVLGALARPGPVVLPRFDKAADDRMDEARWTRVDGPVDVVVFEGWCVGARPQAASALDRPVNALEARSDPKGVWRRYVNDALGGDYQALFGAIAFQILLCPPDFDVVADWRIEQEHELRRRRAGDATAAKLLSDDEVRGFVQLYERITRHLLDEMPPRADVVVRLDADRAATIAPQSMSQPPL